MSDILAFFNSFDSPCLVGDNTEYEKCIIELTASNTDNGNSSQNTQNAKISFLDEKVLQTRVKTIHGTYALVQRIYGVEQYFKYECKRISTESIAGDFEPLPPIEAPNYNKNGLNILVNGKEYSTENLHFKGDITPVFNNENNELSVFIPALAFEIDFFISNQLTFEKGGVFNVSLSWEYKAQELQLKSQTINNELIENTARNVAREVTDNTSFTLSAIDENGADIKTLSVKFVSRVLFGRSTEAYNISELTSVLRGNRFFNFSVVEAVNDNGFIFLALPENYKTGFNPELSVKNKENGLNVPFLQVDSVELVNQYGYKELYIIYRSFNELNGSISLEIK